MNTTTTREHINIIYSHFKVSDTSISRGIGGILQMTKVAIFGGVGRSDGHSGGDGIDLHG